MTNFILNNEPISTDLPKGMLLLDFVRYHKNLKGTKIGCREGDCGACTNLIGDIVNDELVYRSFTSCLTALGNVNGKHVVTIEGLNMDDLNPIQQAMADCSATQCGFCTPGFIVSIAGYCLSKKEPIKENAIAAIDGNICRCTGYKSIEKALFQINDLLADKKGDPIDYVTRQNILPSYFSAIKVRLSELKLKMNESITIENNTKIFVGGGTDLYVQKHDAMKYASIDFMYDKAQLNYIKQVGDTCFIGPSVTVTDLQESVIFQNHFPDFNNLIKLISSTPIRNMATIAGNIINASPIGDFSIFFLAMNAMLTLSDGIQNRQISLRSLYKGYKQLDKTPEEYIAEISFKIPEKTSLINFEKVCKRTHLDIASVNSAIHLKVINAKIQDAAVSAGGVGPIPMFLDRTSTFLVGKPIDNITVKEAVAIAQSEVTPISDARGTAEYKSLLLGQLIKAHFITFFKNELNIKELIQPAQA